MSNPDLTSTDDRSVNPARFRWVMVGGASVLAALAGFAWYTQAGALFLELASAALAMCF